MDEAIPLPRLLVLSKGAQGIPTLPALLPDYVLRNGTVADIRKADCVMAWGRKPSAIKALAIASRANLPVVTLEDGFLRSMGLGADEPPLSLIVDDLGVYYDASAPSRLEQLIATPLSPAEAIRARALQQLWQQQRVSKYNDARIEHPELPDDCVLLADQTFGDASLQGADPQAFNAMLEAALERYPTSTVLLKVHPDVVAGRKQGHFDLAALATHPRVQVLANHVHPAELLPRMRAVYVMTSQLGFDALLWNVPVHTWGMPFYAGWGLTQDRLPPPSRRHPVSLEQLVHASLVRYARYVSPETGQSCTPEVLMHWLGLQRRHRSVLPASVQMLGFSRWKEPLVMLFFKGSAIQFVKPELPFDPLLSTVSWGCKHDTELTEHPHPVSRVEDGFLRSVGLGAGKTRPLSWVVDDLGIYYDATRPSRLERILLDDPFEDSLQMRAQALREAICRTGVTKYNLPGEPWVRPAEAKRVILVTGQVEDDASIRFGANRIRSNLQLLQTVRERNPDAWILYKPHPEVLAGTRARGSDEAQTVDWCDEVIGNTPLQHLFEIVDEVHVLTSQSGFEALLRGVPVTTYGQPFYAGWGLTRDEDLHPGVQARRTRTLNLDQLVAGTLLLYPTYVSRITDCFTTAEQTLHELQHWRASPQPGATTKWQDLIQRLNSLLGKMRLRN
ncbi:MAG: capsular polysaccharide biosynthesis protein [Pseudomonadales bacterium]|uniref:capsular polysaccharide biosynthesis protein n=1 Tax=Pseudomonas TaxID=286 RepID=UPI00055E2436|nr:MULTISPECIES: capsular polysaccharide biosynthesis protein [Pseudomonas]AUB75661.1 capsular biosynthesis protein [Pseudomonas sp. Lz4W]MCB1654113.1 capsular polysaccharide biosynthesis protein [Pseudomonadales bacterium]NBF16479.1 capsular polysaccharide biosynthesis protein [Pseudomonas sp. Fl4BN2]NBG92844.1 capsular polysaccharide biosynthesis protein [Pseudomonas sp. 9.1(2019)]